MATQIRAFLAKGSVNSTTQTFTKPTSPGTVVAGDLLVAQVLVNSSTAPNGVPSGWTIAESIVGATSQYIYVKTAGGSEPASYDWTWATAKTVNGGIIALYSDASLPLSVLDSEPQVNASSTNRNWPSVTAPRTDTVLCCFGYNTAGTLTPDPVMTERWDQDATFRAYLMTQALAASGATGTRTATQAAASTSQAISVIVGEPAIVSGAASLTLDALTVVATGTVKVQGAASITLGAITLSATGTVPLEAGADLTLDAITLTATGAVAVKGQAALTLDAITLNAAGLLPPPAPTGVSATGLTTTSIRLAWSYEGQVIDGFSIERSTNALTGFVEIDTVDAATFSYIDTGLASNTEYFYKIRAFRS